MSRRHVVLLDDDIGMLRALERLLGRAGFRVTATHEPGRAIEAVVRDSPDAIVSDLYMPDLGGNIVLAMVGAAAPRTARLLLTGETDFHNVAVLSIPYSVDAYLPKREVSDRLVATLRELLDGVLPDDSPSVTDRTRTLAMSIVRSVGRQRALLAHPAWERRTVWARHIAVAMGLDPKEVFDVELGALLHDIGEVGVPEDILCRSGPLTPGETDEVRRHPTIGASLLWNIVALRRAIPVVQTHHERVDGKGYPKGLVGDEIARAARIVHLVAAYDAMTHDRPYRPRMSDSDARRELARCAGSQFDLQVHATFANIDAEEWISLVSRAPA
jgi:response regulator RpfG family c-di-GMP phosphodiesterase